MITLDPQVADDLAAYSKGFREIKRVADQLYDDWLMALRLGETPEVLALHRGLLLCYHQIVAAAFAYPNIVDRPGDPIIDNEQSQPKPYSLRSALLWVQFEIRAASLKSIMMVLQLASQRKLSDHDRQFYDKTFFKVLWDFQGFLRDPEILTELKKAFPEMLPRYQRANSEVLSIIQDQTAN